jgi:chondroitin 4-sulfotransferase 11
MPIDVDRQFIFVHIPRTAGTAVELMFELGEPHKFWGKSSEMWPDRSLQHLRWLELKATLPQEFVQAAFKFSVVRNPWDRFVSEYWWHKQWFERCIAKRGEEYVANWSYGKQHFVSLDAFVDVLSLPLDTRLLEHGSFDAHLETQVSFLADEHGRIAMDSVGRFETFERDIRCIAQRVGRQLETVRHAQSSKREKDYHIYYTPYARDAVAAFYKDDIEAFGYTF